MFEAFYMICGVVIWECLKWYWRVDFFRLRGL
ncbi:hypothetical protein LCGC14_1397390 [marine sediment metagenome]|uniref:Uncharacterized protein n=1 Tax=marine sediment metagenome TaxID=412755 RepID=A0A0F9MDP1_9ZZZZ